MPGKVALAGNGKCSSHKVKINDKIKLIITCEEFDDKPIQAKIWRKRYNFEEMNDVQRIIYLFFNKDLPLIFSYFYEL